MAGIQHSRPIKNTVTSPINSRRRDQRVISTITLEQEIREVPMINPPTRLFNHLVQTKSILHCILGSVLYCILLYNVGSYIYAADDNYANMYA